MKPHLQLLGYQSKRIEVDNLAFLSLDLGIVADKQKLGRKWSYTLSTRLAKLLTFNGVQITQEFGGRFRSWYSSNSNSPPFRTGSRAPLKGEMLRGYDIGLYGSVRYRLIGDLHAELGVYQGLLNQWSSAYPGSNHLLVSSASIGLAAKIR